MRNRRNITGLAIAVARGSTVAAWARQNEIPPRTAYRWSKTAEFKGMVDECRRKAIDRSIGDMCKHLLTATREIARLIKAGDCDSVRLAAARTLLDQFFAVRERTEFRAELQSLQDELAKAKEKSPRAGDTGQVTA